MCFVLPDGRLRLSPCLAALNVGILGGKAVKFCYIPVLGVGQMPRTDILLVADVMSISTGIMLGGMRSDKAS